MLNKKLILGSLAGATLLLGAVVLVPTDASAGLVAGPCVSCHTMHNSVDLATVAGNGASPRAQLLKFDCIGCHAYGTNDVATGRSAVDPKAPQVNSDTGTNSAGYFNEADGTKAHNVAGLTITGGALATAPGGTMVVADLTCTACHGAQGGHHSSTGAGTVKSGLSAVESYRMLQPGGTGATTTAYVATRSLAVNAPNNNYNDADSYLGQTVLSINAFCASCHADFHAVAPVKTVAGNVADGTDWIRHPTEVTTIGTGPGYVDSATASIPVGTIAQADAVSNQVLCISCHRAHGSGETDMLRFSYSLQVANDGSATTGCETCHGAK